MHGMHTQRRQPERWAHRQTIVILKEVEEKRWMWCSRATVLNSIPCIIRMIIIPITHPSTSPFVHRFALRLLPEPCCAGVVELGCSVAATARVIEGNQFIGRAAVSMRNCSKDKQRECAYCKHGSETPAERLFLRYHRCERANECNSFCFNSFCADSIKHLITRICYKPSSSIGVCETACTCVLTRGRKYWWRRQRQNGGLTWPGFLIVPGYNWSATVFN